MLLSDQIATPAPGETSTIAGGCIGLFRYALAETWLSRLRFLSTNVWFSRRSAVSHGVRNLGKKAV